MPKTSTVRFARALRLLAHRVILALGSLGALGGLGALAHAADPPPAPAKGPAHIACGVTTTFSVTIGGTKFQTLWKRELMRQALLLAAREELGYTTFDNALGDGVSRSKPSLVLACRAGNPDRISLELGAPTMRQKVWEEDFRFAAPWPHHRAWVERMEQMSRTVFVEALAQAKVQRHRPPRKSASNEPLAADLARSIDEDLSFCGQFLALRQLHGKMVQEGESPAALAGLVRSYAHLGLLTEHQWHPMSYAFKARSLLYAQRWVVRAPQSQSALQHRAYAFALVGMHGEALADLQSAAKLADPALPSQPTWLPLIEHYCKYDFDQLKRLRADKSVRPLALLLCFLAHEQEGTHNLALTVGLEQLEEMPGCYRMIDTLCHFTGPGAGHMTSQVGMAHLATTLLPRLDKVAELPPHVRQTLKEARAAGAIAEQAQDGVDPAAEAEHRAKLVAALRGLVPAGTAPPAPDSLDPSWAVLAKWIEETTFLQLYRRAFFVGSQLGVPADDVIDLHRPIVANHRSIAFVDQYHSQADRQKIEAATRAFGGAHLDYNAAQTWIHWPAKVRRPVDDLAQLNMELLPNEAGLAQRTIDHHIHVGLQPLLPVSPHSPFAMGVALRCSHPERPGWDRAAERSPYLALSFFESWTRRADHAKAERYLVLATKLDPSPQSYITLANHYRTRGDEAKWLQALKDSLQGPQLGLLHAQIQCEIAQHYANRREWDQALPYADAAAETGAEWALQWSQSINEANQNWEAAEAAHMAAIERYGADPVVWYLFCQRNGCGNVSLARQTAFPDGVDALEKNDSVLAHYAALVLILEAKPSKALAVFERTCEKSPASWIAMQVAITADQVGEKPKRDAYLKRVVEQPPAKVSPADSRPHREELVVLARSLIADLAAGGKGELDLKSLHAVRDRAPERDRCSFNYFLACYLDNRGKSDLAIDYWKQCMGCPDLVMSTRTAAGFHLHKRGVKPSEWRKLLFALPEPAGK